MRSCESVIITLRLLPKELSLDMELPAFLPLAELADKVLETLRSMNLIGYERVDGLRFSVRGEALSSAETLASLGFWDGSILDAVPVGKDI